MSSATPSPTTTSLDSTGSPTTSAAESTSTSTSAAASAPSTSSASLYLYTFLATLILLLSISGAIVVRSYILRRRQRLIIEEAIRNGTYVPPVRGGVRVLGEKPRLHDVVLAADVDTVLKGKGLITSHSGCMYEWAKIMPIAASVVRSQEESQKTEDAPAVPPVRSPWKHWRRRGHRTSSTSAAPAIPLTPPRSAEFDAEEVRLAFLIAMPAPHRKHQEGDEELPHVEFGLARAAVRRADGEAVVAPDNLIAG